MFDCYYEPEPDFKTVFHPEKGTKGMIQETFATAAAFCRIQNENNAVAWNNYFLMQDNTFLQQQIVDLKDENRLLMSKYTESDIHTLCTQIQQSYDDFCKHGIQEFKDRTLSGIAAFVKKCKENLCFRGVSSHQTEVFGFFLWKMSYHNVPEFENVNRYPISDFPGSAPAAQVLRRYRLF